MCNYIHDDFSGHLVLFGCSNSLKKDSAFKIVQTFMQIKKIQLPITTLSSKHCSISIKIENFNPLIKMENIIVK